MPRGFWKCLYILVYQILLVKKLFTFQCDTPFIVQHHCIKSFYFSLIIIISCNAYDEN